MLEMIDTLGQIVEADIPFRIHERRARVVRLRDMMDQAEVTASEKYRRVMEAYQGELEFGRTTEAYSDTLPTTGQTACCSSAPRATKRIIQSKWVYSAG